MTQISERVCKKSLEKLNIWFVKLQNIHFTTTCSDFIVLNKYRYLIEVKEVSVYKGHYSFSFDRLTQEADLINFEVMNKTNNFSYVLLNFRDKTLKTSNAFLIPLFVYLKVKKDTIKKSINLNEALTSFIEYKLTVLPGSIWDLSRYII